MGHLARMQTLPYLFTSTLSEFIGYVDLMDFREILPEHWVMLDIPSQYMHYCLVLLCEVYCVIV